MTPSTNKKARIQAYYLPQFHPIPENDEWWGKGFTEWTNVAKARPLFKGHWQPRLPADLGFYDLRIPEVREAQAKMADEFGVEGFCYYHYWFGNGRQLLQRPFDEVLTSAKPDLPFSLCWANGSWTGVWYGETDKTLMEQRYGGRPDYESHFDYLRKAFIDDRYITVDGKPMFQIHIPRSLPDSIELTDTFRELAHKSGFKGLYLVAGYSCPNEWVPAEHGFDAVVSSRFYSGLQRAISRRGSFTHRLLNSRLLSDKGKIRTALKSLVPLVKYERLIESMTIQEDYTFDHFPCIVPNWDNTPRSGERGSVVVDSTPQLFKEHAAEAIEYVQRYAPERRFVFVKSWNEWAEGNYLEPDSKFGLRYLEAIRDCVSS